MLLTLSFRLQSKKGTFMRRQILFKVERRRVLVPVGAPCPFGCRYCYTRGGEVGLARVDATEILSRFRAFTAANQTSFETIQFGYDGDPFACPERGIAMLRQLATMDKHLNFSTKASLADATLDALSDIHSQMVARGMTMSALVSLSCWDSAPIVEPHTPDAEYERVMMEGVRAGCEGFIVGPLYADARRQFVRFIPPGTLETIPSQTCTVSWSAHAPTWTRYEDPNRLQRLIQMIERHGGRAFQSSADAMMLVQQK